MKRFLCLVLGVAVLVGLIGCTGGVVPGKTTEATEPQQTVTEPVENITEATDPVEDTTEATEPEEEPTESLAEPTEPEFVEGQEYTVKKLTGIVGEVSEDGGEPVPFHTEYVYEENRLMGIRRYSEDVLIAQWTYDGSIDRVLTEEHFFEDGDPDYKIVYEYADDGKRVKENWFGGEELMEEHTYTYDDAGNLILWSNCCEGEELQRLERSYDDQGNITGLISYDGGSVWLTEEYRYDDRGTLLEVAREREGVKETQVYSYDDNGRRSSAVTEDTQQLYTYDDQGRLTQITVREQEIESIVGQYQYDAFGRLILYADMGEEYTYRYDVDGNLIGFYTCYPSGSEDAQVQYETVTVTGEVARELAKLQATLIADPTEAA